MKRKSMQINEAYAKADQKEMSIHVASLRACFARTGRAGARNVGATSARPRRPGGCRNGPGQAVA